jgi:hypothetical protein
VPQGSSFVAQRNWREGRQESCRGSCSGIRWGNWISRRAAGEERREWIRWCGFT